MAHPSALAALAAFLQDSGAPDGYTLSSSSVSPPLAALLTDLSDNEASALVEFEAAAHSCCSQLEETTLQILRSACDVQDMYGTSEAVLQDEMGNVRALLESFATEPDGKIEREQFKEMLARCGVDQHFSPAEIDELITAADTNKDNFIELEEFVNWVYAMGPEDDADGSGTRAISLPERSEEQPATCDGGHCQDDGLRDQVNQLRESLEETHAKLALAEKGKEAELRALERRHGDALSQATESHEAELESSHQFWRSVAQSSAAPKLGDTVDLGAARLIGHGKYGFVFKTRRLSKSGDEEVGSAIVVKLLSIRWAHVAAKEYQWAQTVKGHPNIVEYKDVILHSDDDKILLELLKAAQEHGKLQTKTKRSIFPDRFLCLTQEFMNRGTVQDWMDRDILMAGGMLVVMRCVAGALAHMHQQGLTHNDIKPENIFLAQWDAHATESQADTSIRGDVIVKLGDLGLADKTDDCTQDYSQYGMTALCMTTGEKFGTRKFQQRMVSDFVHDVAGLVGEAGADAEVGDIAKALTELPEILCKVWGKGVTMAQLKDWPSLQNWGFFDGAPEGHTLPDFPETPKIPKSIALNRIADVEAVLETQICSARRMERSVAGVPA